MFRIMLRQACYALSFVALSGACGGVANSAEPGRSQQLVLEVPSQTRHLNCEVTPTGLVCRVKLVESVPYGGEISLQVVAVESGAWGKPQLAIGKLLKSNPEFDPDMGPKPPQSGDKLSFEWNFRLDPNTGDNLYDREMAQVKASVDADPGYKKAPASSRDKVADTLMKQFALRRTDILLKQQSMLELDEVRLIKTRRACEKLLAPYKLSHTTQETLIAAFSSDDSVRVEAALKPLAEFVSEPPTDIQKEFKKRVAEYKNKQLSDQEKRGKVLEEMAKERLATVRDQSLFEGWACPPSQSSLRNGVDRLRQLCEWQAAELLFLQTHFQLDPSNSKNWVATSKELREWLETGKRTTGGHLKDADISRLLESSRITYSADFTPWVADKTPDVGWTAAQHVALKTDVVGAVNWRGQAGSKTRPYAAWLRVDAPEGLQCDFAKGGKDVTWCVVSRGNQRYVRFAPRKLGTNVDFEARIHHPQIKGGEIRWNSPPTTGEIAFPF